MDKKKGFFDYFLKSGVRWRVIILLLVGVGLILLSTVSFEADKKDEGCDVEELCSSVEGVGECRVMLLYGQDGKTVEAVAVVCDGGDSITVRHRLTELLSAFYGIGYHRISIEAKK